MNNEILAKFRTNVKKHIIIRKKDILNEYTHLINEIRNDDSCKIYLYLTSISKRYGFLSSNEESLVFEVEKGSKNESERLYYNIEAMETTSLPINEAIEFEKENLIIDVDLKSKILKEQLADIKEKLINLGTESFMHYYCERPKPNPYSDKMKYVTNDIVQDYIKGLYKESEEETVNKVYKKYNNKIYKV